MQSVTDKPLVWEYLLNYGDIPQWANASLCNKLWSATIASKNLLWISVFLSSKTCLMPQSLWAHLCSKACVFLVAVTCYSWVNSLIWRVGFSLAKYRLTYWRWPLLIPGIRRLRQRSIWQTWNLVEAEQWIDGFQEWVCSLDWCSHLGLRIGN